MMSRFSVVFCGTPAFALPSLRALAGDARFDVRLVITQPDRPAGRSGNVTPPPVKTLATELGIETWQPETLNTALETEQRDRPDFLVVVAYGQLLSQATLSWPRIAPINVHGSLLPRWRGASPVEHAILHGDAETGITVQRMVKELDAGPILGTARTNIGDRETAVELRERLAALSGPLLVETLSHPLHETPQPSDGITICRKLSRADGLADPQTMTAEHIDRMVRAYTPWPGVTLPYDNRTIKVLACALGATADSIELPCANGTVLHLYTVQEAGKRPQTAAAWLRGQK